MKTISNQLITVFFCVMSLPIFAQSTLMNLIPSNTATHTAVQSGSWFDTNTWNTGTIPSDAAIVMIPNGISVNYEGQSTAHIFAIRVDGEFLCTQTTASDSSKIIFDTFVGTMNSKVMFHANGASDGYIDVAISPFDIEAHKAGTSGYTQVWNAAALAHYSDGETTYDVTYTIGPDRRFKTYADALAGNTTVVEASRTVIDDGVGVLGRYLWDSTQISIGFTTMGEVEIIGQEKSVMAKLSANAPKSQKSISLATAPTGWKSGDDILVSRGGNISTVSNATEVKTIDVISGTSITTTTNLNKNHEGRMADDLHCYVGNLNRNIIFHSTNTAIIQQRGHFMAMNNPTNIQIKNAAFIDMGRTDKSKLLNDLIWDKWVEPVVFNSYVSPLGQECVESRIPPKADISNHRGRYSIHIHRAGAANGSNMAQVTGNVVRGNPGWGITHHDSHANVSDNVVYEVIGSGIVSESGSETGVWNNNFVVGIDKGHTTDVYDASMFYEDYLFSGQGLGMKGRGVVCDGNVMVDVNMGIGVMNMNAAKTNTLRMDSEAFAATRTGGNIDQFPLSKNGYSKEGDGIMPVELPLVINNSTVIWSTYGLSSIERDMGVSHESRSVFENLKIWGAGTGVRITYQNDYSFKNLFISGKNATSLGLYLWKHSHNHTFEGVKFVDLDHAMTPSKLVEHATNGTMKTRNNGFTPWVFIDMILENVTHLYGIEKDSGPSATIYDDHPDNPIYLSSTDLHNTRSVTFTPNSSADLEIDLGTGDLQFSVDGAITDKLGTYEYGLTQAASMDNLRTDYEQRIYEFASQTKLEEYLTANGIYKDESNGDQLYFIIYEYVPDRISLEYKPFPIRVNIMNAPATSPYSSPQTETPAALAPQNQLISRAGTATQSSTSTTESFQGVMIDPYAAKAIDGNNNGRPNVQFYQYNLLPIGSAAITNSELEPWWDLDLGEVKIIEHIDIWNTVEMNGGDIETNSTHFKDFYVLVSDTPFGSMGLTAARANATHEFYKNLDVTRFFSLDDLNITGQYIRIQAVGTTKLGIAEVDVIGRVLSPEPDCNGDANGLAYIDNCNTCVMGNTGLQPCALDCDNVWGGTNTSCIPLLPIELILFQGELIGDKTLLEWETALELTMKGYEIERSKDAQSWESIGFVYANNRASQYDFWDNLPFMGHTYYRLKIVDNDGSFSYSNVVVVKREGEFLIQAYPNPTKERLVVNTIGSDNSTIDLVVWDILGRAVLRQTIASNGNGQANTTLDVEDLPSGMYYLECTNREQSSVISFVKE